VRSLSARQYQPLSFHRVSLLKVLFGLFDNLYRALGGAYPGALASYVNVKHKLLHVLPDNVTSRLLPCDLASLIPIPDEQAALIEVLATAVHAVERSGIQKGQTCLVTGPFKIALHALAERFHRRGSCR
jgi:threonine dehydrogenase-like Zn-dependent dehydrogenase